ncbi:MAG: hypothetical protein KGJ38_17635, partial [Burkholderiaceae bacterium]|nr:hypothetical protein [Burkholderiaceae bacterium]
MCYSAQIKADYQRFVREYGAVMSFDDFAKMVHEYFDNPKMRVPKAMTAPFGVVVLFVHFLTVSPKTLLIFNELRIRRFRASRPFRAKSHGFA